MASEVLLFYPAARGKVTGLWIWGQSYLSLLSPKGSTASEGLGVVRSKILLHRQTWRQGRLKCTQHVLMLPTNLHRPPPWHRSHSAGRPPFLVTWPPIRGRAWSRSSLCLETSGPWQPQCCDECHRQSRSLNLKKQSKTQHHCLCNKVTLKLNYVFETSVVVSANKLINSQERQLWW